MGLRGPAPAPTKILKLLPSSDSPTRKAGEPEASGRPKCPEWITTKEEAREWRRVCGLLQNLDVLAACDGNAIGRYVRMVTRWRAAEEFIAKHGEVFAVKKLNGEQVFKRFPQSALAAELAEKLLKIEEQFGLTPSARSRIDIRKASGASGVNGEQDPLGAFVASKQKRSS